VCEEYFTINGENPIAAKENYCEKKEDAQILAALSAIRSGTTLLESPNDTNYEYLHCLSQAEAKKTFSDVQLNNLERLVSSINLEIKQDNKINFIKFNPDHDSRTLLANMCKEGLTKKLGDNVDINYIKRLKTELDVIDKMNFNDYFLVVQDYVR
jgi:DNA polymerase-3 subunit alpha